MEVELGKIYENKTKQFLVPGLRLYGDVFKTKLGGDLFKLAYGIHDMLLEGSEILEEQRPVFIMCDKAVNGAKTWKTIEWFMKQDYYITDYSCDFTSIPRRHMLVLKYPEILSNTYDKFLEGKYSEMYSKEQIELLFPDKEAIPYKVLTKSISYMPTFISKVEEVFDVRIEDKTPYTESELEFPISMNNKTRYCEIFNY